VCLGGRLISCFNVGQLSPPAVTPIYILCVLLLLPQDYFFSSSLSNLFFPVAIHHVTAPKVRRELLHEKEGNWALAKFRSLFFFAESSSPLIDHHSYFKRLHQIPLLRTYGFIYFTMRLYKSTSSSSFLVGNRTEYDSSGREWSFRRNGQHHQSDLCHPAQSRTSKLNPLAAQ